jgi:hypothetical protein
MLPKRWRDDRQPNRQRRRGSSDKGIKSLWCRFAGQLPTPAEVHPGRLDDLLIEEEAVLALEA